MAEKTLMVQMFIAAINSLIGFRRVGYLSVPTTSGPRLFRFLRRMGLKTPRDISESQRELFMEAVLRPNVRDARRYSTGLRKRHRLGIINPTILFLHGWSQEDYISFWKDVVEVRCSKMFAAPGWEFSYGCRQELQLANALGLPILDLDGRRLTKERVDFLIEEAEHKLNASGFLSLEPIRLDAASHREGHSRE